MKKWRKATEKEVRREEMKEAERESIKLRKETRMEERQEESKGNKEVRGRKDRDRVLCVCVCENIQQSDHQTLQTLQMSSMTDCSSFHEADSADVRLCISPRPTRHPAWIPPPAEPTLPDSC